MNKVLTNEPVASILMNSMRSMGYTFETAVSDIIDNSISANAHKIIVQFPDEDQKLYIYILDDGVGMSRDELIDAMKYGSEFKVNDRSSIDLGRFGLGLKSASLSQCRKLTVLSKCNNDITAFCWDLSHIEKCGKWEMIELDVDAIECCEGVQLLKEYNSGTIVLWEDFDVIAKTSSSVLHTLHEYREILNKHISLVFHRFIADKIEFYINNYQVQCIDPFLEDHKKTNIQRPISIPIKSTQGIEEKVIATPYILPYQSEMSKTDIARVGGLDNYKDKQGFYLYRNKRLIIWGTWFGSRKQELTKNARIKIDIPNTLDDLWEIDIKKQSASIPIKIKKQLTSAVFQTMEKSRKIHEFRGRVTNDDDNMEYIWNRLVERDGSISYSINRDSSILQVIKEKVSSSEWDQFNSFLSILENSFPFQQLYIDKANDKKVNTENTVGDDDLIAIGLNIVRNFNNKTTDEKIKILEYIEVFKNNSSVLDGIRSELNNGNGL